MNEWIQFSPTAADGDHSYFPKPQPMSDPVQELLAPLQSLDLEVQQVVEGEGKRMPCWTSGMPIPAGGGLCVPWGRIWGDSVCGGGQGGGLKGGCALTLPVATEGAGQSGHRVWHLHGQGVGQARGQADFWHPAQLQPPPLPGLPAYLAEEPRGLPAGCHQVSVMQGPAGREGKVPQRGGLRDRPMGL